MNMRQAKKWYIDATIGYLILNGFSKREAHRLARRYGIRKMLADFTMETLHYPVEQTGEEIISLWRNKRISEKFFR